MYSWLQCNLKCGVFSVNVILTVAFTIAVLRTMSYYLPRIMLFLKTVTQFRDIMKSVCAELIIA